MAWKKVLDNQCPSCKAPIKLDPKSGKFVCEYCGNSFTVDELNSTASKTTEETNKEDYKDDYKNYVSFNCPDCGAEVVCDENTAATFCVYCGNTNIIRGRLEGDFKPTGIIPFKHTKEDAIEAFKSLRKGRPFMPKEFNDSKHIEKITGVYIPFWLYHCNVSGDYNMKGERVTSWTTGNTHYTKTDSYDFIRNASMNFTRIPVDGSKKFENDIMNTIEPFDFKELVDYNHAYLSGFLAEKYDVDSNTAFEDAKARSLKSAEDVIRDSVSATSKRVYENTLACNVDTLEYVLLPVYMLNIKWKDKYYTFAMNGQTGEFVGNIPIDIKKVIIYILVIGISLFAIIMLIFYLLFVGGYYV